MNNEARQFVDATKLFRLIKKRNHRKLWKAVMMVLDGKCIATKLSVAQRKEIITLYFF